MRGIDPPLSRGGILLYTRGQVRMAILGERPFAARILAIIGVDGAATKRVSAVEDLCDGVDGWDGRCAVRVRGLLVWLATVLTAITSPCDAAQPPSGKTFAGDRAARSENAQLGFAEGWEEPESGGRWQTLNRADASITDEGIEPAAADELVDQLSAETPESRMAFDGPQDLFDGECTTGDCAPEVEPESPMAAGGLTSPVPQSRPTPAAAGSGGGLLGLGGPPGKAVSFDSLWIPQQPIKQQAANLGLFQQDFSVSWPIWTAGTQGLSFIGSVRETEYRTTAILPDGRRTFPDQLWNVKVGVGYFRMFSNGWMGMVNIGINSASDEPFRSSREVLPFANALLRVPTNATDAWIFALVYSPYSQLPFPVPGVAYQMVASEQWQFSLGIPFGVTYRPTSRLRFELSYLPVTLVNARATWQASEATSFYAGFGTNIDGYLLVDRPQSRDLFYSYDQRLMAGWQQVLPGGFSADVSAGYVFNRYFYEGHGSSSQDTNRLDVGDGLFVLGRIQKRF